MDRGELFRVNIQGNCLLKQFFIDSLDFMARAEVTLRKTIASYTTICCKGQLERTTVSPPLFRTILCSQKNSFVPITRLQVTVLVLDGKMSK